MFVFTKEMFIIRTGTQFQLNSLQPVKYCGTVLIHSVFYSGATVRVCLPFDLSGDNVQKTVTDLLDEWQAMGQLYQLVTDFADSYNGQSLSVCLSACLSLPVSLLVFTASLFVFDDWFQFLKYVLRCACPL